MISNVSVDPPKSRGVSATIACDAILLVEGSDEADFIEAILLNIGLQESIEIINMGGKDKKRRVVEALTNMSAFTLGAVKSVGVVFDADDNAKSAFDKATGLLKDLKYSLPIPEEPCVIVGMINGHVFMYFLMVRQTACWKLSACK